MALGSNVSLLTNANRAGLNRPMPRAAALKAFDMIPVAVGSGTTTAGVLAVTITGLLATDLAFVTPTNQEGSDYKAVCTENTLTITCTLDAATEADVNYMIMRPTASA